MIVGADFVRYLISAGGVIVFLVAIALWQQMRPSSGKPRRVLLVGALTLTVVSTYGVQYYAGRMLISPSRPFVAADATAGRRTAIVVLGSGSNTVSDWGSRVFAVVDHAAAARVLEAVRVFRLIDPELVVASGGTPHPEKLEVPTGQTMRDALVALGVPAERILVETDSKTTREEAVIVAAMLRSRRIEQVVLVTSDVHMRRSTGAFRAAGVETIPAIAHELTRDVSWSTWLLPTERGLDAASAHLHEVFGTLYYSLRGWH